MALPDRRRIGSPGEVEHLRAFLANPCGPGGGNRCRYAALGPLAPVGSACRDVFAERPVCDARDADQNFPKPNDYLTYALRRMSAQDVVRRELTDPRVAHDVVCLISFKDSAAERALDARAVKARRAWVRRQLIQNGLARLRRQRAFGPVDVGTYRDSAENYDAVLAAWRADAADTDASPLEFEEALVTAGGNSAQLARVEAYLNQRGSSLANWSISLYREPDFRDGIGQIETLRAEIAAVTGVREDDCGGTPDSVYDLN